MAGDYLWMLQIILECLAIVCNIAGLITIHSYHKKTNQNIILGYLSTAQILFATALLVTLLRERYDASILLNQIAGLLNRTSGISLLVGMYALTIDRMVCIINPIKYKSRISRKKTKLILLVGTIVIFILCTSSFLASYFLNSTEVYLLFGVFVFQVVFVILAAVTYSISFYKVLKARKTLHTPGSNQETKMTKLFLVPSIIIGTYIVFYFFPLLVYVFMVLILKDKSINGLVARIIMLFGLIADPLTYIFFSKHYRDAILRKTRFYIGRENRQNSNGNDIDDDLL